jgi:hypothetical protein
MLRKLFATVCAVAVLSLKAAHAATFFPIVTNNADISVSVASDGTNYLVGIQGDYANPHYYITAQMFGPTGALVGSRINPVPGHTGGNPVVACSLTNYLMVWPDDYGQGSLNGQLIDASGGLQGTWFAIAAKYNGMRPGVAYGGGRYLVVWDDYRSGTNWAIYGQLFSSSGALVGSELLVCGPVDGQDEKEATIAFDGTNFLVVWQLNSTSGGNHNVTYGVFISPSGTMGTPFPIGQTVSADRNPMCAVFNGTNYLVLWNVGSESDKPIYGRFVTPAGSFLGSEFLVVTNGAARFPFVAFDGANYLLSWIRADTFGTTNSNVYFQFLDSNGQPIGCQFTPFSAHGKEAPQLAIPLFDGKRFVIVANLSAGNAWSATNNAEIYGAFLPASTTRPQLAVAAPFANNQFSLSLAGTPGINYAIQVATNLVPSNWTSLVTNSPTNGAFSFTDTGATNRSRFYRAVAP